MWRKKDWHKTSVFCLTLRIAIANLNSGEDNYRREYSQKKILKVHFEASEWNWKIFFFRWLYAFRYKFLLSCFFRSSFWSAYTIKITTDTEDMFWKPAYLKGPPRRNCLFGLVLDSNSMKIFVTYTWSLLARSLTKTRISVSVLKHISSVAVETFLKYLHNIFRVSFICWTKMFPWNKLDVNSLAEPCHCE